MWQTHDVSPKNRAATADSAALNEDNEMMALTAQSRDSLQSVQSEANLPKAEADQTKKTASGDQPTYTADTIPPVSGLKRLSETADSLHITWDEIPGVAGYRVYRRDDNTANADYMLYTDVKKSGMHL